MANTLRNIVIGTLIPVVAGIGYYCSGCNQKPYNVNNESRVESPAGKDVKKMNLIEVFGMFLYGDIDAIEFKEEKESRTEQPPETEKKTEKPFLDIKIDEDYPASDGFKGSW